MLARIFVPDTLAKEADNNPFFLCDSLISRASSLQGQTNLCEFFVPAYRSDDSSPLLQRYSPSGPEGYDENGSAAAFAPRLRPAPLLCCRGKAKSTAVSKWGGMRPLIARSARTALPVAHFDRNAAIPVTDLVH